MTWKLHGPLLQICFAAPNFLGPWLWGWVLSYCECRSAKQHGRIKRYTDGPQKILIMASVLAIVTSSVAIPAIMYNANDSKDKENSSFFLFHISAFLYGFFESCLFSFGNYIVAKYAQKKEMSLSFGGTLVFSSMGNIVSGSIGFAFEKTLGNQIAIFVGAASLLPTLASLLLMVIRINEGEMPLRNLMSENEDATTSVNELDASVPPTLHAAPLS